MKDKDMVTDPVCGMVMPKDKMKTKVAFKGRTYYFCNEGDRDTFVAHPEHWITKKHSEGNKNQSLLNKVGTFVRNSFANAKDGSCH